MKNLFIFTLFLTTLLSAQTDLEKRLAADIEDYDLDHFSKIEAAFILSGASQQDSLNHYLNWYYDLIETLRDYNMDMFDRVGTAHKIFQYLHGNWLITYKEKATTLLDVVREKRFNCVAGTILYNLVCESMGYYTEAFETPTHTYTLFPDFDHKIMVENTATYGFNILENLHEYSQYLLKFYPREQRLNIGLDRIYAYEQSKGRQINNLELLGLLAYNRAYFANQAGDYERAYQFVLLAQQFNADSRSNTNFEINLYYRWGKKLAEQKKYNQAFQLFADAFYRYPDIKDFQNNCRISFHMGQRANWLKKDWPEFKYTTLDAIDIDILDDEDMQKLQGYLQTWVNYAFQNELENKKEILAFYEEMFE